MSLLFLRRYRHFMSNNHKLITISFTKPNLLLQKTLQSSADVNYYGYINDINYIVSVGSEELRKRAIYFSI